MHKDSFDLVFNAEDDCYYIVVDEKIQKVVDELKALPHDVLIRYLTYWSEAIESRKYVVKNGTPTVVTMLPAKRMKNGVCMSNVWRRHLGICCKTSSVIIQTSILQPCAR